MTLCSSEVGYKDRKSLLVCVHLSGKEVVGVTVTLKLFAINFLLVDTKSCLIVL